MVRQKSRWILARLDFEEDVILGVRSSGTRKLGREDGSARLNASKGLSGKDIHKALREMLSTAFGTVGAGMVYTIQVCLYDEEARLAIIKAPRDYCTKICASLTFVTSIENNPVAVSVRAICGSARTAKVAGMHELRLQCQQQEVLKNINGSRGLSRQRQKKEMDKELV
eukprot:CAMPEP_0113580384 /NCGR_PEP_ID=MMETSP0015_2-20120614/30642_1 /TAXON_ID=2838 /ORGANISM="Odontella" /LENGTH=168 /DNA_ID=CAMNT_0000484565 /DNA_START=70 /DNA_END=572 /DNA_ORIENTATION=+ /assembly_acc=CAM_ASM_000160